LQFDITTDSPLSSALLRPHVSSASAFIGIDEKNDFFCSKGHLHRELAIQLEEGEALYFRIVSEAKNGFGIQVDPR
jgi:hypothetical protein